MEGVCGGRARVRTPEGGGSSMEALPRSMLRKFLSAEEIQINVAILSHTDRDELEYK